MTEQAEQAATREDIYTDFDVFLKQCIHDYYRRSGKSKRANFIALLISSGELGSMAVDSIKNGTGIKKLALGAAGLVALRIGLRYALSGPLGILLAGATAASLVAYFVRHRKEVVDKIATYRTLVADLHKSFAQLQSDYRDGRLTNEQRNLMVDGLMQRFLNDLDK